MNEERRRRKNARRRERYRDDADYREKLKASQRARYANDEEFREKQKAEQRERWANDDDYREKQKAMRRNRYANDGEFRARFNAGVRASRLKHQYGLSIDEYRELLERQNHACGICERPFVSTPHVDHCHITNWVRGLLCRKCNLGLGHFDDNPVFLFKAALYTLRWLLHLWQVFNKEENNMTTTDDPGDENKAARVMRKAILHELHQPFGIDRPPPTDHLQAVARALVIKAAAQDVSAIKEILERIDGKTPSTPTLNDLPQLVNLSWKLPSSPSEMSPSNPPPSRKSKSTTGRAPSSSPSTDEPSGSPAS
jgi:Recombination endonuclease VII